MINYFGGRCVLIVRRLYDEVTDVFNGFLIALLFARWATDVFNGFLMDLLFARLNASDID